MRNQGIRLRRLGIYSLYDSKPAFCSRVLVGGNEVHGIAQLAIAGD
jgi:hypothetical protein